MKENRSPILLYVVLVVSLAANVAMLLTRGGKARSGATAGNPHPVVHGADDVLASLPRELAPYAALGSYVAENNRVADLKWSEAQYEAFAAGMRATYDGRGLPLDDDAKKLRDEISARVQAMIARETPDPVEDYFRTLRDKEGVTGLPSGLHYRVTLEGNTASPRENDTVVISYSARLPDGASLPSLSKARVRVNVRDLLPGMAEGVQLLKGGGKGLLYLPKALSYGDGEWPPEVPRGAPIVFFVELHEVIPAGN